MGRLLTILAFALALTACTPDDPEPSERVINVECTDSGWHDVDYHF